MRKLTPEELSLRSANAAAATARPPLVAVLENVRSAYNVGSLFRTADAFGLTGVRLCGYTAFPPHKEIRKTALGAEDTVAWKHFRHTADCIAELRSEGYAVWAAEQTEGSRLLHTPGPWPDKMAVVFGNEVTGVDPATLALCDGSIEIPQFGAKHSLNIATAAGVVLWEIVRTGMLRR